ncbi:hypothetical protein V8E55_005379 [Tylopilus felleus]
MPRAGPSRSQRARGRRPETEDDDSENNDLQGDGMDVEVDGGDHLEKKALLGSYTRSSNAVLLKAQVLLRKMFAMELVELQARNYCDQDPAEDLQNATGVKQKAALSDERLLEELAEGPDNDDDDDDIPHNYGSIIAWSTADQLAAMGLLHVILALILVTGRSISELDLRANLRRLRITNNGTIPSNAQSTHRSMHIDIFLQHLAYEWRWGNRAHSEVGEQAVARLVGEFMVERKRMVDVEEEAEGARGSGGLEMQSETTVKAIERAAGGSLTDVK